MTIQILTTFGKNEKKMAPTFPGKVCLHFSFHIIAQWSTCTTTHLIILAFWPNSDKSYQSNSLKSCRSNSLKSCWSNSFKSCLSNGQKSCWSNSHKSCRSNSLKPWRSNSLKPWRSNRLQQRCILFSEDSCIALEVFSGLVISRKETLGPSSSPCPALPHPGVLCWAGQH